MGHSNKTYKGFNTDQYLPDEYWNRRTPASPLDIIKLSEEDLLNGSDGLLGKPEYRWRFIETPALSCFSLIIDSTMDDPDSEFRYDYEPLPDDLASEESEDGLTCKLEIACRISYRWSQKPWWTPVAGMLIGVIHDPVQGRDEPTVKFEWVRDGDCDGDLVEFVKTQMRHALSKYIRVQAILLNRPEVFKIVSVPAAQLEKDATTRPHTHKQRKAKLCRVIVVDREKIQAVSMCQRREILCPCWGVIGHVRHYKSGRDAWIKPYVKGKARQNMSMYSSKQYEVMRGVDEACEI